MRGNALLKAVNPLLLLALLVLAVTGVGMMLFEWEAVHEVHEAVGIALVVLAAVHVILNWRWLRAAYRRGT
jgi:protein-S-isoprenylcysteine O-methyltransferase Ste14